MKDTEKNLKMLNVLDYRTVFSQEEMLLADTLADVAGIIATQ